jgi:hypothetical protein
MKAICVLFPLLAIAAQAQPYDPVVLWDRSGAGENSQYGGKIVALGDQNDDGYSDFAVWALGGDSAGTINEEKIEFFHGGNPPGTVPYMTFSIDPHVADNIAHFEGVGDVNGDGYKDWDIWWHYLDSPDLWTVCVYFGGPAGDTIPDFTLVIPVAEGDVKAAGDFNGDSVDDLYRYYFDGDFCQIIYGGSQLDTVPDWMTHSQPGHSLQAYAWSFGDVNGDGHSDFVSDSPNERITYVFLGGANPDTLPAYTWEGFWTAPYEIVHDLNHDGKDDIVFAVSGGHMNVHLGRDTLSPVPDFTLNFDPACAPFRIPTAGDFNHDGYNDLVVVDDACNNLWGTLSLYLGYAWLNSGPVLTLQGRTPPLNLIGINNATGIGDVNGDGVDDLVIAAFNTNWDGRRGRVVVLSGDTTLRVRAEEPRPEIPQQLDVTVYPNPFNSETTILLSIPVAATEADLTVYNLLGQQLRQATLRNVIGTAHYHFDAAGLSSGIYLLRVRVGSFTNTQKLVVLG